MDEILEIYREVKKGLKNQELFNYNNINIHFSQGVLNVYDTNGMPAGRYNLPKTEELLVAKLNEMDKYIEEIVDNNQYICGKCGEIDDLPEFKRTRAGVLVCETCCNGGDIRKDKAPKAKPTDDNIEDEDPNIPSTSGASKRGKLTEESAIEFLKSKGFTIKKRIPSYKVVYLEGKETKITDSYFRNQKDFESHFQNVEFVSFIKKLSSYDEEPIE